MGVKDTNASFCEIEVVMDLCSFSDRFVLIFCLEFFVGPTDTGEKNEDFLKEEDKGKHDVGRFEVHHSVDMRQVFSKWHSFCKLSIVDYCLVLTIRGRMHIKLNFNPS